MTLATGRPLRALLLLLAAYAVGRAGVATVYSEQAVTGLAPFGFWAAAGLPPAGERAGSRVARVGRFVIAAVEHAVGGMPAALEPPIQRVLVIEVPPRRRGGVASPPQQSALAPAATPADGPARANASLVAERRETPAVGSGTMPVALGTGEAGTPAERLPADAGLPSRRAGAGLSASVWAIVREGSSGAALAPGGTLGGSQLGARLSWRPNARAPVFLTVRASTALRRGEGEIAPGIGVQGKAGGIILEQRVGLDRGDRSRTALLGYAGFTSASTVAGFAADGYAQAGAVGVRDPALFADGAVRVERPVLGSGRTSLGIGAGAWGAAQPGASRVDVGPQLVLHLPLAQQRVRLAAEYRVRVAGRASPGNGVALTLGADF